MNLLEKALWALVIMGNGFSLYYSRFGENSLWLSDTLPMVLGLIALWLLARAINRLSPMGTNAGALIEQNLFVERLRPYPLVKIGFWFFLGAFVWLFVYLSNTQFALISGDTGIVVFILLFGVAVCAWVFRVCLWVLDHANG